ncbi:MAG: hypothetical protein U5P10_18005 [Spirochaetia bacterium]|nr:hypothetical protein [Spirochaetia bacterium]
MIETVKCVAVLKANIEHGRDYLDTFLPFIASLAKEKSYKSVDIPKIQSDFKEKYGIKIPYHALRSILSRGMRSKLIKKSSDNYIFIESKIDKFAFTEHVKQKEKEIEYIYDDFCKFCLDVYNIKISEEKVTDIIISYLKKYDAELLILSESILPETSVSQKEEYVFYKYITELYNNREHDFRIIVELAVGYLFASTIFFSNIENRRISLKNSSIFLDTRLLLRLIGLEGKEKQGYYETLLVMLKKNKAKIKVFEHTIDEANHILDESIRLIGRDKSSLQYIGPSLKFFIEEKYSASDIMLIKAKLEKTLNEYGIKTYDGTIELKELDEFINEKRLEELILEEYNIQQDTFLQWKKRNVILRDVKSISRIRQYRKGHFFSSLRNCNAVFITTNSALARSSRNYILEEKGRFYIPECVTDVFVGTHVWLDRSTNN